MRSGRSSSTMLKAPSVYNPTAAVPLLFCHKPFKISEAECDEPRSGLPELTQGHMRFCSWPRGSSGHGMEASIADEWARAAHEALAALVVLGGSVEEVVPWGETVAQIDFSTDTSVLRTSIPANLLRYRANYSRVCAAWLLVCAVRHPFKSVYLVAVLAGWFHALLVRRGVVHIRAPAAVKALEGRQLTLMGRQLMGALGAFSLVLLVAFGCLWHALGLVLFPLGLAAAHAAVRRPLSSGDELEQAAELRQRVLRALRGKHVESEELEAGASVLDDPPPPVRDAEMQRRVEAIRAKYRWGNRRDTKPCRAASLTPCRGRGLGHYVRRHSAALQ